MSGLLMGIRLQRAGKRFRILEQATSVGGTWRENRYPGLSCDVPSFFYSYSFEPNPDWTHRFSPGPEIRSYFERVAKKYGLDEHITFGTTVTGARYLDGRWEVETSGGERIVADVQVEVDANGRFEHVVSLERGANIIVVEAVDGTGNTTYRSETIHARY